MIAGQNDILYTGSPAAPLTVPDDGTITAYLYGAAGFQSGGGGYITGTFPVSAGQTIYVNVGGKGTSVNGGYNGGGNGGDSQGGGGGGFSSVGLVNSAAPPYLLIAGGGASGFEFSGAGGGGGFVGGGNAIGNVTGGTQIGGGISDLGGSDGTQYMGGSNSNSSGGGGGWYGGGSGTNEGDPGGGGSSYPDPLVFPGGILTEIETLGPTPFGTLLAGQSAGDGQPYYQSGVGDATGSGNGLVVLFYTPNIVCFLKGTLVQTPSGNIPIEDITTNSFVNNQHGKPVKVIYTTSRTFSYAAHPDVMYKIPKDARGNTTDLFITKQHPFFINGERKEARDLGFSVASEAEVVDENGNITVYNISIVDGNIKNLILVNGHCEIGTGET